MTTDTQALMVPVTLDDANGKQRHLALADQGHTIEIFGRRGKTHKGSIQLTGARLEKLDAGASVLIAADGARMHIADAGLAAKLSERQAATTMSALIFDAHGPAAGAVRLDRAPKPMTVPAGFALVKVYAASLNPVDKIRIEGGLSRVRPEAEWPAVIGYDLAGVIEAANGLDALPGLDVGDAVAARMQSGPNPGAVAEYALVQLDTIAKIPDNVTFEAAASLGLAGETALQALRRGGVGEGKNVLITGGAGGVGTLAIQIAKLLGAAHVATTASAGAKATLCAELGADTVVDYKSQAFEDVLSQIDVAFDTTNESARCASVMRAGGEVVTVAGMPTVEALQEAGNKLGFVARTVINKKRNVAAEKAAAAAGAHWSYMFLQPRGADLQQLLAWVSEGKLRPVIDQVWPMEEAAAAAARCFSGRAQGKCVVRVRDASGAMQDARRESAAAGA